jgi:hypothetical protein
MLRYDKLDFQCWIWKSVIKYSINSANTIVCKYLVANYYNPSHHSDPFSLAVVVKKQENCPLLPKMKMSWIANKTSHEKIDMALD